MKTDRLAGDSNSNYVHDIDRLMFNLWDLYNYWSKGHQTWYPPSQRKGFGWGKRWVSLTYFLGHRDQIVYFNFWSISWQILMLGLWNFVITVLRKLMIIFRVNPCILITKLQLDRSIISVTSQLPIESSGNWYSRLHDILSEIHFQVNPRLPQLLPEWHVYKFQWRSNVNVVIIAKIMKIVKLWKFHSQ